MDLAIEANRNSALFNTMQQVLDVYNPLLHTARPVVVNETKHRIRVTPTRFGNTLDSWNGPRTVRFDMPRIGSLVDFTLKAAFTIPGVAPTDAQRSATGDRGFAKTALTLGTITDNTNNPTNNARGRLDRLYADRLFGFNMIERYTVSSKSRQIFSATGEYLLTRFSQMDADMKEAIIRATTPVNPLAPDCEDMFYSPGTTYMVNIPLYMFFNEHITNALDVNFSEEVHIDISLRAPSRLFYYGQLGDLSQVNAYAVTLTGAGTDIQGYTGAGDKTGAGLICWDQAVHDTAAGTVDTLGMVERVIANDAEIGLMQSWTAAHIQGVRAPFDQAGTAYGTSLGNASSGPNFAYPDVDALGESLQIQLEGNADFVVQDTDAYRALRAQQFPEGTGLTTIVYDTSQETFSRLFASEDPANNLLDTRSGGSFTDPSLSTSGITIGNSTRFVDLPIRTNNLAFATHFMVRKHSDLGGSGNTSAGAGIIPTIGSEATGPNTAGAFQIYSRCLPVHYFQLLAAGRVIYESDADSQLDLTQSNFYNGTSQDISIAPTEGENRTLSAADVTRTSGRPFNVYSINFGLQASRLENTGSLSYQNLNNPTLRIYFKPDTWAEFNTAVGKQGTPKADVTVAAGLGVQVDVIHEFFNVVTVNSGNGEITSGLNQ
jgi:hypothetical protein